MNRDELLAADRITDWRGGDRGADVEAPQWLQLLVVKRREGAVECPAEDETTGCRHYPGIIGIIELGRCRDLAGRHIDRRDLAPHALPTSGNPAVPVRAAHAGLIDLELGAAVDAGAIGQMLRWVEGGR